MKERMEERSNEGEKVGQRDDSLYRETIIQAWQPGFNPSDPHGGREELIYPSCLLRATNIIDRW